MIADLTLFDELERYVGHLRSDGSAVQALATVQRTLREFLTWGERAGVKNLLNPTLPKLERYVAFLHRECKLSPSTIHAKLGTVAAFYEWLYLFGCYPDRTGQGVYMIGAP